MRILDVALVNLLLTSAMAAPATAQLHGTAPEVEHANSQVRLEDSRPRPLAYRDAYSLFPVSESPRQGAGSFLWSQADCNQSNMRGNQDAGMMHNSGGWLAGGVGSGLLLSLIGTGIITAIAASSNPQPTMIPDGVDETCYRVGYNSKAKSKNTVSALVGGLAGSAVWIVILVSASS